ncbi:uncharacterized protein LOC6565080 [Drosophila grimshawi]|uniref:GH12916 n=1 Tax=Drosophila grimshawi TaxID=7222 RepID=B4JIT7_DROGR|nr:uncharacterized protein LOC6565080 [Drosophila grimshawi]EDW00534.1 GH12916 [Drosophila grimshawi]
MLRPRLLGLGLGLLLAVFPIILMLSQLQCSDARVIYFNQLNTSIEESNKNSTKDAIGKGMLLEVRGPSCRHGFMRDHHNRCRRIV